MIIGLTGFAGSGKSEVARVLTEEAGFQRVPFAGPLKAMLSAVGFSESQLWGDQKSTPIPEFDGVTPRHVMQTLGTEWGRRLIHSDIWVILWRKAVAAAGRHVVVDDVRFPNEVETIRALGGAVWRVERTGVVTMGHESESYIAELAVDLTILNEWTLDSLRHYTRQALSWASTASADAG